MSSLAILIDFGSTFTKLVAVDLERAELLGRAQAPSTVATDVREGLLQALALLHVHHHVFDDKPKDLAVLAGKTVLASSSAAGGLRIAVVGNVPGLTVEAANQAALGAGAKIVGSTAFKVSQQQIAEIEQLRPDMILLTGGVDGGDTATILHNARALANSALSLPVVVAGNQAIADDVAQLLQSGNKETLPVQNVMPKAGTLAVESAREAIRRLFMPGAGTLCVLSCVHVIAIPPDQNMSTYRGKFEWGKISHGVYPEPVEWVRDDRLCHSEQSEESFRSISARARVSV